MPFEKPWELIVFCSLLTIVVHLYCLGKQLCNVTCYLVMRASVVHVNKRVVTNFYEQLICFFKNCNWKHDKQHNVDNMILGQSLGVSSINSNAQRKLGIMNILESWVPNSHQKKRIKS